MTAEELRTVCAALNLAHREAARIIGVNERHFRRQCGGTVPVTLATETAMLELLRRAREAAT